jgi:hypothetical protein
MTLKLTIKFRVQSEILEAEYSGGDAKLELGQANESAALPPSQPVLTKRGQ